MTDEAEKAHTSHLDSEAPPKEAPARRELVVVVKQEEAGRSPSKWDVLERASKTLSIATE